MSPKTTEDVSRYYNQQDEYRDDVEKALYFRRCHGGYLLSELGGVRKMGRELIEPATDGGEKKEGKNTRPIGV